MIEGIIGTAIIVIYILFIYLYERKEKSNAYKVLAYIFMVLLLESLGVFLEVTFSSSLNISPIYFEYMIYLCKAFLPGLVLLFAFVYDNPKTNMKKYAKFVFIPTIIIVLTLITNPLHEWIFKMVDGEVVYGLIYYLYIIMMYFEFIPAVIVILRSSTDKSGFLSPQTILLLITCIIPFMPRIMTMLSGIIIPEYIMPMVYTAMAMVLAIGILKYNVLNAIPVALIGVIDLMSDAFVVINSIGDIVDYNKSFDSKFAKLMNLKDNKNIYEVIQFEGIKDLKKLKDHIIEAEDKGKPVVEEYHLVKKDYDRYFEVQIQPIRARLTNGYIATLLVFKDITEQKNNIDAYIKSENLSVIGELVGGVAHDINTPITAIKSGLIIMRSILKSEDELHLIENMTNSADKISNLVNSLKNQVRNFGSNSDKEFSLTELVKDLYVVLHADFVKHNVRLNINANEDIWISGNSSRLAQALSNIIQNSIEAYDSKGGIIDVDIYRDDDNNPVIKIEDWAGGIKEKVRPLIFKKIIRVNEMPTAGVGLYLAYSVIKGSFGGEITFDTKTGRGTRFYVTLPNQ